MTDTIDDTKPVTANATAGVINNITINVPPLPKPTAHPAIAKKSPPALPATPKVVPPLIALPNPFEGLFSEGAKKDVYYDAETGTVKHTRYTAKDGSTAVLREDPSDHRKVTLTLTDAKGQLVTQGNARGFSVSQDRVIQHTTNRPIIYDSLTCPTANTAYEKSEFINVNENESVTRDKLKQFAEDHPALGIALRGERLPVTVVGGIPKSFGEAIDTPSQYRACPENRSGIVLERLTEKSAAR